MSLSGTPPKKTPPLAPWRILSHCLVMGPILARMAHRGASATGAPRKHHEGSVYLNPGGPGLQEKEVVVRPIANTCPVRMQLPYRAHGADGALPLGRRCVHGTPARFRAAENQHRLPR